MLNLSMGFRQVGGARLSTVAFPVLLLPAILSAQGTVTIYGTVTYTESVFISGLSSPANGLAIRDDGSFTLSEFGGDDVAIFNSDGSLRRRYPGVTSPDELTVFAPMRTGGVPEPSTTVLLVSGIVGLGILARRRVAR